MSCHHCGHHLPPGALTCPACGAETALHARAHPGRPLKRYGIFLAGLFFLLALTAIGYGLRPGPWKGQEPPPARAKARTNPKDGAVMAWVPAGEFLMGSTDKEGFSDERPQRRVYLDGYWIYKYEVTVAQYRAFCQATGRALPRFPPGRSWAGKGGWTDTALQGHPIVNVTWHDATAYADWAGVSLPPEAQWEKAARGTDGRLYPWGNAWDGAKCANSSNSSSKDISTWPAGSFPVGVSWCGAHDLAGNVWEWCADWYQSDYYKTAPSRNPTGPATGDNRVLRGGSWLNGEGYCRGALRYYFSPDYWSINVGFRCLSLSPGP